MSSRLLGPADQAGIDRLLIPGILAGMVAAVPMGLFAMVVAAIENRGFFRPMHQIAYVVAGDGSVRSLEAALAEDPFVVHPQMVLFGVVTHLAVAGFFGAVFGVLAHRLRSRRKILLAGVLYGLAVMVFMGLIVLPIVALVLDAGDQISGIPSRIGWGTFAMQHVIYGLVLGRWPWPGAE